MSSSCEVCGSNFVTQVLDLGDHPLCDDLVSIGDTRKCEEYPIKIGLCNVCLTAHQFFQVPKNKLFTKEYHYRARMTKSVLSGMEDLVRVTESKFGPLNGKVVLDIGCNDGSLLNFFKEAGAKTIGVEPTGAAADCNHTVINDFFDDKAVEKLLRAHDTYDIITFTNVFAHIEDLPTLIKNLRALISEGTNIIIENHYLGSVLQYDQFDTFYHEHPRTYSVRSFEYIAQSLGLNLTDYQFVSRYGGNIRAFLGGGIAKTNSDDESSFQQQFIQMGQRMEEWRLVTASKVLDLVQIFGPLPAKAFPGRAAILIQLLGLDERHISAVYEITGSKKVGHYVPGTRIPILPEKNLFDDAPDITVPILNLAWHIPNEVIANIRSHSLENDIIHIKEFSVGS